jgi:hypothetical protein
MDLEEFIALLNQASDKATDAGLPSQLRVLGLMISAMSIADCYVSGGISQDQFGKLAQVAHMKVRNALSKGVAS